MALSNATAAEKSAVPYVMRAVLRNLLPAKPVPARTVRLTLIVFGATATSNAGWAENK